MHERTIGSVQVGSVGLGEMPLSLDGRPEEERAIATIAAALDAGVTLIDTADAYCRGEEDFGHGEVLVAKALRELGRSQDDLLVATKGGHIRPGGRWELDGRPEYLKRACEASLKRLGAGAIGLYQFHRPDPRVPYGESIGALRELAEAGLIRMAGISNADVDQIAEARDILGEHLVSVQNEFSPQFRSSEEELEYCARHGLAFLPWSPLGGIAKAGELGSRHGEFARIAREHGVSPQQVCLAWMLAKADVVIPIPGSSRPETIRDSAAAAGLRLGADELARLDGARPQAAAA
jgi:aryl-alcohol dehydrogenase-like predicted oxidoreductase